MPGSGCVAPADIDAAFSLLVADVLRTMALDEGVRADGRGLLDLRPVFCEVQANNDVNQWQPVRAREVLPTAMHSEASCLQGSTPCG